MAEKGQKVARTRAQDALEAQSTFEVVLKREYNKDFPMDMHEPQSTLYGSGCEKKKTFPQVSEYAFNCDNDGRVQSWLRHSYYQIK
jgi:hypothetical protein